MQALRNLWRIRNTYLKPRQALRFIPAALEVLRKRRNQEYRFPWGDYAHERFPGPDHYQCLDAIHDVLRPRTYLEIGVCKGKSLRLAHPATVAIGVDPLPRLSMPLPPGCRLIQETSDCFFKNYASDSLVPFGCDLAFLDGLHTFEQTLTDFLNLEKYLTPRSVVILHDVLPISAKVASKERNTSFWTGDVWKILPCLSHCRPALEIALLPAYPSGLGVVSGFLDGGSCANEHELKKLVDQFGDQQFPGPDELLSRYRTIQNSESALRAYLLELIGGRKEAGAKRMRDSNDFRDVTL